MSFSPSFDGILFLPLSDFALVVQEVLLIHSILAACLFQYLLRSINTSLVMYLLTCMLTVYPLSPCVLTVIGLETIFHISLIIPFVTIVSALVFPPFVSSGLIAVLHSRAFL